MWKSDVSTIKKAKNIQYIYIYTRIQHIAHFSKKISYRAPSYLYNYGVNLMIFSFIKCSESGYIFQKLQLFGKNHSIILSWIQQDQKQNFIPPHLIWKSIFITSFPLLTDSTKPLAEPNHTPSLYRKTNQSTPRFSTWSP